LTLQAIAGYLQIVEMHAVGADRQVVGVPTARHFRRGSPLM
jgi:hypothetical protein